MAPFSFGANVSAPLITHLSLSSQATRLKNFLLDCLLQLGPVVSTVRYEMMKLCTGLVIDYTGSENEVTLMPLYIEQRRDLDRC